MKIIYNLNGTVDFLATREIALGNPSQEDILNEYIERGEEALIDVFSSLDTEKAMEFWSDPCWIKRF